MTVLMKKTVFDVSKITHWLSTITRNILSNFLAKLGIGLPLTIVTFFVDDMKGHYVNV